MEVSAFIPAIEVAATNAYSLIAFLAVIVAWTAVALKIRRHKILINNIKYLPQKDRLSALRAEMGVFIKDGSITADHYIIIQNRKLMFAGLVTTLVALIVIVYIVLNDSGKVTGVMQ